MPVPKSFFAIAGIILVMVIIVLLTPRVLEAAYTAEYADVYSTLSQLREGENTLTLGGIVKEVVFINDKKIYPECEYQNGKTFVIIEVGNKVGWFPNLFLQPVRYFQERGTKTTCISIGYQINFENPEFMDGVKFVLHGPEKEGEVKTYCLDLTESEIRGIWKLGVTPDMKCKTTQPLR
jgi:preprotein translocase subunit YajC